PVRSPARAPPRTSPLSLHVALPISPPKVWEYDPANGGQFAGLNRPTAGAREEKELPIGEHPFQLYSLGTPNGVKATIMFEELIRSEEHTSELQSRENLVCRLLLEKK